MISNPGARNIVSAILVAGALFPPASRFPAAARADGKPDATEGEGKAEPPRHHVRLVKLSGGYVDFVEPFDPFTVANLRGDKRPKGFYTLCDAIDDWAESRKITHVVFDLSDSSFGMNLAQLDELQRRLDRLRKAGKKLGAWLQDASPTALAVAACCDHVIMADTGGVDMPSVSMQQMFFRDAMDLVGIKADVLRAGTFKGAVEPYMHSRMSEHLRTHYLGLVASLNDAEVSLIARRPGLTADKVRDLQKRRWLLPEEAVAAGLVDEVSASGSLKAAMEGWVGDGAAWIEPASKSKKEMSVFDVFGQLMKGKKSDEKVSDNSIVVIHLNGQIQDGTESSPGRIVSGPAVRAIREIAGNDRIKGVVVRVNSPGGSASASDAIRDALVELQAKKPTVVSMGEYAASGGYMVSCIGVPVYAERGTTTGSIGVFGLKFSCGAVAKRLGVNFENIALDEAANAGGLDRGYTEEETATIQKHVEKSYDLFLTCVSESRGIPREKLLDLAGGRVWSGAQAKEAGLVDELGGLDDCLAAVAKKAGLAEYSVVHRSTVEARDILKLLEDDEEKLGIGLTGASGEAIELLRRRGLMTSTLEMLLRDGLESSGRPTVWALGPVELRFRSTSAGR